MIYRILGEATMVAHFLVIAYIGLGGFLAWLWPRLFWPHLAISAWGLVQIAGLAECPLTAIENWARAHAGERGLAPGGFIDTYIQGTVYPAEYAVLVRWIVVGVVLVSWAGFYLRRRSLQKSVF
ncbi:DUF2784 domain-containing protein [Planotetraspora sp. A-T 1434]|uniref:DUF2784 domain-containing protein n=1 Tax=Planotetraspora sp. A-T 1434 TaxID=2979219 RepID=UPI0021C0415E|nr:DUF2784 domain-containing protein [Planotetraspora sp. A-T 1434]MCT9930582.1 DUF2784 domain-containing protein [Planotetraspora sp. A-T 1434]